MAVTILGFINRLITAGAQSLRGLMTVVSLKTSECGWYWMMPIVFLINDHLVVVSTPLKNMNSSVGMKWNSQVFLEQSNNPLVIKHGLLEHTLFIVYFVDFHLLKPQFRLWKQVIFPLKLPEFNFRWWISQWMPPLHKPPSSGFSWRHSCCRQVLPGSNCFGGATMYTVWVNLRMDWVWAAGKPRSAAQKGRKKKRENHSQKKN